MRFVIGGLLFLVLAIQGYAASGSSLPESLALGKLEFSFERGHFAGVLSQLNEKDFERFPFHVALSEQSLGLPQRFSAELLEAALKSSPDRDTARLRLAQWYFNQGDCKNALKHLKGKAPKLGAKHRDLRAYLRGQCFIELGNNNFAAQSLSEALEGEYAATAYFNLASDYAATSRNPKRALMSLKVARDVNNNSNGSALELNNLINLSAGALYLDNSRPELANDFFNQIALDSIYVSQALYLAGLARLEVQDYRGAIQAWQTNTQYAMAEPGVAESIIAMPNVQARSGYQTQALESYIKASAQFQQEQKDIASLAAAVKKHGAISVLLEDNDQKEIEWFLNKDSATNTRRAGYMRDLAQDKEFYGLLESHTQLKALSQSTGGFADRLENILKSLKLQKKLKGNVKQHGVAIESFAKRLSGLFEQLATLEKAISGSDLSSTRSTIEELESRLQTLPKAVRSREAQVNAQIVSINKALDRIKSLEKRLTEFRPEIDKALTKAATRRLEELSSRMTRYYEKAELGLVQILEAQARLRTKRTNLLDGRYQ